MLKARISELNAMIKMARGQSDELRLVHEGYKLLCEQSRNGDGDFNEDEDYQTTSRQEPLNPQLKQQMQRLMMDIERRLSEDAKKLQDANQRLKEYMSILQGSGCQMPVDGSSVVGQTASMQQTGSPQFANTQPQQQLFNPNPSPRVLI